MQIYCRNLVDDIAADELVEVCYQLARTTPTRFNTYPEIMHQRKITSSQNRSDVPTLLLNLDIRITYALFTLPVGFFSANIRYLKGNRMREQCWHGNSLAGPSKSP